MGRKGYQCCLKLQKGNRSCARGWTRQVEGFYWRGGGGGGNDGRGVGEVMGAVLEMGWVIEHFAWALGERECRWS